MYSCALCVNLQSKLLHQVVTSRHFHEGTNLSGIIVHSFMTLALDKGELLV
jgi:hypothetical protein